MSDDIRMQHSGTPDNLFDEENYPPPPADDYPGPPDLSWDDMPSAEASFGPADLQLPSRRQDRSATAPYAADPDMAAKVLDTIRSCLAAMHGRAGDEVIDLVQYILASENALKYLTPAQMRTLKRVAEVLVACAADDADGEFNLHDLPDLEAAGKKVVGEVAVLRTKQKTADLPVKPTSTWRSLCEQVQRVTAKQGARLLMEAIDGDLPADELMRAYTSLEPPTTQKTIVNESFSKSAADWIRDKAEADAERPTLRISSGYRTMDFAMTAKNADGSFAEPCGSWKPGEVHTLAAPSGNGKSSAVRRLITAAAEDLVVGWGRKHAKVLLAFTEESAHTIAEASGLLPGQPFHHLAGSIVLADVGASRKRFIHAVWDLVIEAYHRAKETGLPIVDAGLPEMICLDYITAIQEPGESETMASEVTMDLLLRGLAGWRIREMEQFSGESFAAYAGMAWPSGMDRFQPAILGFAQFRKIDGAMFYDPATCNEDDFVVENDKGLPGWKVEPTDFRVPRIADIRGSGKIVQHSDSVILLHRSRPTAAKFKDPNTGQYRLTDDRARWIFLKTRNSADLKFIPMRFDSNATGKRGQFYDLLAERAIAARAIMTLSSYTQPGDPILPARPSRSPFDGVVY